MEMDKDIDIIRGINTIIPKEEFCFIMGEWKSLFPENEYKLVIAKALNAIQSNNQPGDTTNSISGYLVNPDEIYLIMDLKDEHGNIIIDLFREKLLDEITRFINYIKSKKPGENAAGESLQNATIDKEQLFACYPINNYYLVKIITGQKIELAYDDPALAMLKDQIRHNNFSSFIDYSGAAGPVGIKK